MKHKSYMYDEKQDVKATYTWFIYNTEHFQSREFSKQIHSKTSLLILVRKK